MKKIILLFMLIMPAAAGAETENTVDIRDEMTMREYKEAGLDKLSEGEIEALNKWLTGFVGEKAPKQEVVEEEKAEEEKKEEKGGFLKSLFGGAKYTVYKIEEAESNHRFKINGNYFTSVSVCPGYSKGDEVIFREGRADGMCETGEFARPDGEEACQVFCR